MKDGKWTAENPMVMAESRNADYHFPQINAGMGTQETEKGKGASTDSPFQTITTHKDAVPPTACCAPADLYE